MINRRQLLIAMAAIVLSAPWLPLHGEGNLRREVLLRTAIEPGHAPSALASLNPRRVYTGIPFDPLSIPGLSSLTHDFHFNRHYCEYARRWEATERDILAGAASLSVLWDTFEAANFRRRLEFTRQSAALILLHELYWKGLAEGTLATPGEEWTQLEQLALETHAEWFLIEDARPRFLPDLETSFRIGGRMDVAIDTAEHAWLLDHHDFAAYIQGTLIPTGASTQKYLQAALAESQWTNEEIAQANRSFIQSVPTVDVDSATMSIQAILRETGQHDLDASAVLRGLRLLAGPEGFLLFGRVADFPNPDFLIVREDAPSGLPNFRPSGTIAGLAP